MVKVISWRRIMNRRGSRFVGFNSTAMALLATVLPVSGGAPAHDHKGSENQARVVAHIPFTGLSAIDMAMQNRESDRVYLDVPPSESQGAPIIDMSKHAEAKAPGVIPWPDPDRAT